jgi:hypothetical protein
VNDFMSVVAPLCRGEDTAIPHLRDRDYNFALQASR